MPWLTAFPDAQASLALIVVTDRQTDIGTDRHKEGQTDIRKDRHRDERTDFSIFGTRLQKINNHKHNECALESILEQQKLPYKSIRLLSNTSQEHL